MTDVDPTNDEDPTNETALLEATRRAVDAVRAGSPSPVIERDGDEILATLVRRPADGEGETLVISGFAQGGYSPRVLHRHGDVDARTWRLPADYLGTYLFWVGAPGLQYPETFEDLLPVMYGPDGRPLPDPTNDDRFEYPVDPERPGPPFVQSVLRGPAAPPERFLGAPLLGRLGEHRLRSEHLGDERRVWVHESVGVDEPGVVPALLVVFDGGIYAHLMHTPEQVDAMVVAGELPPVITLYCHYADDTSRNRELACRDDFADFVVHELVPWAAGQWTFTTDPARSIVLGSSLGGLSAGWLGFRHPERFRNVVAQSVPWAWWPEHDQGVEGVEGTGWLATRWAEHGPRDTIVYTEMGSFETGLAPDGISALEHTHRFVRQLRELGVDVDEQGYSGGHDYLCWRATFARALRSIVARW
jgi:enterochelin esterase family protein